MKTKTGLFPVCGLVFAAILATLNAQLSTASGATNYVGVVTATFTMSGNSTGTDLWPSPPYAWPGGGGDNVSLTASASVKYPLYQTQSNCYLGDLLTNTTSSDVEGTGSYASTYSPNYSWSYLEDPSAYFGLFIDHGTIYSVVVYDIQIGGADAWFPEDQGGVAYADYCEQELMDNNLEALAVCATSNLLVAGAATCSTNFGGSSNYVAGVICQANCSLAFTVNLQFAPSQLTVPFTATPTNGPAPLTVQFAANDQDSMSNSIASWNWNFGDGASTNTQSCWHQYLTNGTFALTLTATNSKGVVVVGLGPTNVVVDRPTLQFAVSRTNGYMPLVAGFSYPDQDSGGNGLQGGTWQFGDGTSNQFSTSPTFATHLYLDTKSKTYSPKLTVTNDLGMAIVATGPVISAVYPPILYTATPTNGRIPLEVHFKAPGADAFTNAITNWSWTFGDGATVKGQFPSHTYTNTGYFPVVLTAKNINGTSLAGIGPGIGAGWRPVYTFGGGGYSGGNYTNCDGTHPQAGLTLASNRLYGAMSGGGTGGSGTIFTLNTDGTGFTNLYNFSPLAMGFYNNPDGAWPRARLVISGGTLYGATSMGGTNMMGSGTLFRINTDGSGFTNLHNFTFSDTGGATPQGLVLSSNTLYGDAANGGLNDNGTVFKLNTDGSGFTVLHPFAASAYDSVNWSETNADGMYPTASLLLTGDAATLYGTASSGGPGGGGSVFSLNLVNSNFTVLHFFTNSDGATPEGELILSGNTLYGTTYAGGGGNNGTVFKLNSDGSGFATLYSFSGGNFDANGNYTNLDGAQPSCGLCLSGGVLYGTTQKGGPGGSGTIFAVGTDGAGFTNLYSFTGSSYSDDLMAYTNLDGANPYAGLVLADGYLYGTADNGGSAGQGALFAFSIVAAAPTLDFVCGGTAMTVSWPSSQSGWTLQQCTNLQGGVWTPCGLPVSDDGTCKSVAVPAPPRNLYLRLAK